MSASLPENDSPFTQKIAVLGAGGFIGSSLVFYLMQLGYKLHILVNSTRPDITSIRGQVEMFNGSIEDEQSLRTCFEGCDAVYHLVGIIAETRQKTFEGTVAEGTRKVVAAAKVSGVKKIYYLSALGATKNSPSKYFRAKWAAERAIIDSGLDYTIFRPSIVYGQGDSFLNKLAKMIRLSPLIPVIGDGKYKLQPVFVEELCAIMADSTRREFSAHKIYEIGGPDQLTYLEILDILKTVLDIKKTNIHLPLPLMRLMAGILEFFMKPAPLTRDQLLMMAAGSICDQTIVEKEFGVAFSSLETQVPKYMET